MKGQEFIEWLADPIRKERMRKGGMSPNGHSGAPRLLT